MYDVIRPKNIVHDIGTRICQNRMNKYTNVSKSILYFKHNMTQEKTRTQNEYTN